MSAKTATKKDTTKTHERLKGLLGALDKTLEGWKKSGDSQQIAVKAKNHSIDAVMLKLLMLSADAKFSAEKCHENVLRTKRENEKAKAEDPKARGKMVSTGRIEREIGNFNALSEAAAVLLKHNPTVDLELIAETARARFRSNAKVDKDAVHGGVQKKQAVKSTEKSVAKPKKAPVKKTQVAEDDEAGYV